MGESTPVVGGSHNDEQIRMYMNTECSREGALGNDIQNSEKVFAFDETVFCQISAVDGVLHFIAAVNCAQGFWSNMSCNFLRGGRKEVRKEVT